MSPDRQPVASFDPLAAKPTRSAKHKAANKAAKAEAKPRKPDVGMAQHQKEVMDALMDLKKNEKLYRSELAAAELEFGENSIEVCRRASKLADLCYHTQRFADAEPLLRQALAIAETDAECGPEHPETAKLINNLGNVLRKQGKLAETRPVLERAVAVTTAVFGRVNPNSDTARANLVELLDELGEQEAALAILTQTVKDEEGEAESPTKNQRIAGSLRGLASVQVRMGKGKEAEQSLTRALALFIEAFGENHPATGSTMSALANLLRSEGRMEESLPHYEKLLAITETALSPMHPQCGIALKALATVKLALGKPTDAMADVERGLVIMRSMHGGVHNLMAEFLDTKASCAEALGDAEAAAAATQEAEGVREKCKQMLQAQKDAAASIDVKKMQQKLATRDNAQAQKDIYAEPLLNPTQERLRKKLASKQGEASTA